MSDSTMKQCTACSLTLPLSDFTQRKNGRYYSQCRKCRAEKEAQRRARNPEACRESNRRSQRRHRDKNNAARRAYYRENRDVIRARRAAYYQANSERVKAQVMAKWDADPSSLLRWKLNTHAAHPTKENARRCVHAAIKAGVLVKPNACTRCGSHYDAANPKSIQAHHADHSRPLDIEWLCPKCHAAHHPRTRKRV